MIHDRLREKVRRKAGKKPTSSSAILDSQSIKTAAPQKGGTHGYDAGKKITGRKRHVCVDTLALIYKSRWTVELFFRFFKHVLGCRHLLSHRKNGIEIQVYCAIIVSMLIALWTGRKPTLRTIEMIRFYFTGWAELDELETHIAKLHTLDR